jgi:hypothetical protein
MPLLLKTASLPDTDVCIINLSSPAEGLAPKGGFLPDEVKMAMESFHTLHALLAI